MFVYLSAARARRGGVGALLAFFIVAWAALSLAAEPWDRAAAAELVCSSGNCTVPFFSQVTLLCPSAGPNFSWFRMEGKSYTHLGHCSGANCTLLQVLAPDSGEYICHDPLIGSSAFSNNTSCTVRLIVLAPPQLPCGAMCACVDHSPSQHHQPIKCEQMSSQYQYAGKPLMLEANYTGQGDMIVTWFRNGDFYNCSTDQHCKEEVKYDSKNNIYMDILTLNKPKSPHTVENYSGHYTANVSSEYGWNTSYIDSVKFTVCRQDYPQPMGQNQTIVVDSGATKLFNCSLFSESIQDYTLGVCLLGPNHTLHDINMTEYCSFCEEYEVGKCSPLKARPNWDIQRYNEPASPEKCPVGGVNITIREADQSDTRNISCFYISEFISSRLDDSLTFYMEVSFQVENGPFEYKVWVIAGGAVVLCVSVAVVGFLACACVGVQHKGDERIRRGRNQRQANRRERWKERRKRRLVDAGLGSASSVNSINHDPADGAPVGNAEGTDDSDHNLIDGERERLVRGPNQPLHGYGATAGTDVKNESEAFQTDMDPDYYLHSQTDGESAALV